MSQVDPRTLELIHAELDGELDAVARGELEQRLESDPLARIQRDQMQRMAASLARLPQVEPPAGLRQRWHGPRPVASAAVNTSPVSRITPRRQWLRPAIGLAAGVLAVAVALQWSGISGIEQDTRQMVGTLGGAATNGSQEVALSATGLSGSVALTPAQAGWNLVFKLDSSGPVAVSATYEPSALRLLGYDRDGASGQPVSVSPGKIAFASSGAQHLNVHLQPEEGGQVRIRIQGKEGAAQDLAITVPAKNSGN
jgi:hypothetical protein